MLRDTLTESRRLCEAPVSIVELLSPFHGPWEVCISTSVACAIVSCEVVRTFASRADAEAFVASEYGIRRQALDGDNAHDGWWLS